MKSKVYVIDDNIEELDKLRYELVKLDNSNLFEFHFFLKADYADMALVGYSIYLLDIDMPEIDGFLIADHIRNEINSNAWIIFVSNHENLVFNSFLLNPFYFVRKRCMTNDLAFAFTKIISELKRSERFYLYKTREKTLKLPYQDIFYFEVLKNDIEIHCKNQLILKERKTLKQVIKEINDHSFIQPYPSIYLNLKHVSEFRQNEFILEDNSIVPISRNRMKMCKESFYRFLNEV